MTLVELSTRVIPRILVCTRVRGGDGSGDVGDDVSGDASNYALFPREKIDDDGESRVFSMTKKNDSTERFRKNFSRLDG